MNAQVEQSTGTIVPITTPVTPMQMLQVAINQNADLDRLQKLMDLHERWEKNEARKAYIAAMNQFKADPPEIIKGKHVKFQTSRGVTEYDHATLFNVCDAAIEGLSTVGITHRWATEQKDGMIHVTCFLTHVSGHSENMTLFGPPDDSGGKNVIQQIASTVSYLQRYTLLGVAGLATKDQDNDGRGDLSKATEPAPEGYENWKADMTAVADEGIERLEKCWADASAAFRRYVVKFDEPWWLNLKGATRKAAEQKQ